MKRPAAVAGLALALALSSGRPAVAASSDAAIAAAVKAVLAGQHVYASPGAPAIHASALTTAIGSQPIWVVARAASGTSGSSWLADIAAQTRGNGTYVLLDGATLSASSNTLSEAGVEAVRAAAVKAHPQDAVAALDEFVQKLASGAVTPAPSTTSNPATAPSSTNTASSVSPLLLLLLIPVLGGVAFAVTRARRRTG
jgi:hypothetical protein